jgi:hypothetical protein
MKIGILWGAGLGDLLVLRPFVIKAAAGSGKFQLSLLSTASHMPGGAREILGPDVAFVQLSTSLSSLPQTIKEFGGYFDAIYTGPYPTLKTRLLATLLRPGKIWTGRHHSANPYILEQVAVDLGRLNDEMGKGSHVFPYGAVPWQAVENPQPAAAANTPYLVIHFGSKERWQTTRWPLERWVELVSLIKTRTGYEVFAVGTRNEEPTCDTLLHQVKKKTGKSVQKFLAKPLADVAGLINSSSGVICHNSGILHIATLLQKNTIAITGSSAEFWQPPYDWVRNVSSGMCHLHCNRYRCPVPFFDAKCIRGLKVETVWKKLEQHILP